MPLALRLRSLFAVVVLCLLVGIPVFGQTETATLSGVISDPKGGVVPDADVTATRIETGTVVTTKTNGAGIYAFTGLMPGHYHLDVRKPGFKEIAIKELELHVQDKLEQNFSLEIGSVSETVTVTAGAPLINTQDATVTTVVSHEFVENLPLNGRSFQSLITLTPGVVLTKAGGTGFEQGQFSINGQRADANYFTVDGVSANIGMNAALFPGQFSAGSLPGLTALGGSNNLVSVDAVEEFRVQTSSYAPEFGRTPGGQVSILTRSGTNQFHGTLFDYFRNDVLDAKDWFANFAGLPKAAVRQNDFGGVLGGPVIKGRTFFFFSYEGLRLRQPQTLLSAEVPSLSARQAAPTGIQPILNAYPKPNGTDEGNGLAIFKSTFSNPSSLDAYSIRVDQAVSSKWRLFGRYNYAPSSAGARGSNGTRTPSDLESLSTTTQFVTVGATLAASPQLSNELRFNYSRVSADDDFKLDGFGGAVVPSNSSAFPSFASPANSIFTVDLGGNVTSLSVGKVIGDLQRQLNFVDNVSLLARNHQLKFGIDYRRLLPVLGIQNYLQSATFAGVGTPGSTPPPGSALSGTAASVTVLAQRGPQVPISNNLSLYAQDTWKISPRLTLTYGLRWELNPPPKDANGHEPAVATGLNNPSTLALAPAGTPLWNTSYDKFSPRVGLAYLLGPRSAFETVLRGGFGIFYDLGGGQAGNAFTVSFPFEAVKVLTNVSFPLSPSDATPPPFSTTPTGFNFFYFFDPNLQLPRTYQWNVAIEQSLGKSQTFSASYVGAAGRDLLYQQNLQTPNPNFSGNVFITTNSATSDYHALQLQYRRRLSRDLQGLASYAWSHSLDIVSADSSAGLAALPPAATFPPQLNRGPSDFDVRHSFNGAIVYDIPASRVARVARAILGGWSVDTNLTAHSGTPVDVTYLAITNVSYLLRPNLLPGIPLYISDATVPGGRRINSAAFSVPATFDAQGTLGRNALRGFSVFQMDFALGRQFHISEKVALQLKSEFFNVFNHPNFADPSGILAVAFPGFVIPLPTFGLSNSMLNSSLGTGGSAGGFNPLYQVGGPRSIQLSLKLRF